MFFLASKVIWFLLAPSNFLVIATVAGLALWRWKRTAVIGKRIVIGAAIALASLTLLPIGDWLLRPLEQRFPRYQPCTGSNAPPLAGILLLGGGLGAHTVAGRYEEDLNDAADRLRVAAQLAREHPDLPVMISGGQVFPRSGGRSEAEGTADILVEFGVPRERLHLETGSRTTAENAALVRRMQGDKPGYWLLVTSAFHMTRSVASFRHAGVPVIPVPTDWHVDDKPELLLVSAVGRLGEVDTAVREYLGLLGYWIGGRSSELFPGPDKRITCPAVPG